MMIKVDYLIERDEKNETVSFSPEIIPIEMDNLTYIQAPNSSGKSTLLNIIALAFFGQKLPDDELDSSLRNNINALTNSNHQKIKFNIEMDNEILGEKLISKKENFKGKDISVRKLKDGKNKPISADNFRNEYKLIYDIPSNPLDRLPTLLNSIKYNQRDALHKLKQLNEKLKGIIKEIQDGKNPETIQRLKDNIKKYSASLSNTEEQYKTKEDRFLLISKYYYSRFLKTSTDEKERIKNRINEVEKKGRIIKRKRSGAYKKHKDKLDLLNKNISNAEAIFNETKQILPGIIDKAHKNRLKLWVESSIHDEIIRSDFFDSIREQSIFLKNNIEEQILLIRKNSSQDLEMVKLIKSLIMILTEYTTDELTIPVINLPVTEFITSLNNDLKKYKETTVKIQNLDNCKCLLDNLLTAVNQGIKHRKTIDTIKEGMSSEEFDELSHENELNGLQLNLDDISNRISDLEKNTIREGFDPETVIHEYDKLKKKSELDAFEFYGEEAIIEHLEKSNKEIKEIKTDCRKLSKLINDKEEDLIKLEKKKPHKYQNSFDKILQLQKHTFQLGQRIELFNNYIDRIIKKEMKYSSMDNDEQEYSVIVGRYFAKKVDYIRHIDKKHKVNNIDVVLEKIITVEGKEIRFSDLGTGQSQAAYLDTLLSMSENKKIVALFDEVAMMDEKSLSVIKNKLRDLYKEGKLFMAIIVQKGEEVKVESLL